MSRRQFLARAGTYAVAVGAMGDQTAMQEEYLVDVSAPEHVRMQDPATGAQLLFVTSGPSRDLNLYFHERSFLADESILLFTSDRERGGLMGYLFATGELARFHTPRGPLAGATAAKLRPSFYALRGREVLELTPRVEPSADPARIASRVWLGERLITTLEAAVAPVTSLNENSSGRLLSVGVRLAEGDVGIVVVGIRDGHARLVCRMKEFGGHVQWSRSSPHHLSFAGRRERIMVLDVRHGEPRAAYHGAPGELVTHEHWWVRDQMLFCGGYREGESHVKLLDTHTGDVRILGAGAWWPEGTPAQLAKWNWWHPAGDEQGRWAAADNWHGDIVVFDAHTTRMHLVTQGHRTYGHGDHPHVGWDRKGRRLVFASHLRGNVDVCVASLNGVVG
ncbi:MAG: hypothetical protein ACP5VE_01720 [Chthonomonadales bacterium]